MCPKYRTPTAERRWYYALEGPETPAARAATMTGTKAHVLLGSGGVKTLAHVGALEVLADAGIEFASVSAGSARPIWSGRWRRSRAASHTSSSPERTSSCDRVD